MFRRFQISKRLTAIILSLFLSSIAFPCSLISNFSGKSSACSGVNYSYSAAFNSSSSYTWTVIGGSIMSGSGTDSVIISFSGAGKAIVKLIQVSGLCTDSIIDTVIVSASPLGKTGGDQSICFGQSTKIGDSLVKGSRYEWRSSRLNEGLVAWYTFDQDLKDHSGNGNDGISSTFPVYVAGASSLPKTALDFGGKDFIKVPGSATLNIQNRISIAVWVYLPASYNNFGGILDRNNGIGSHGGYFLRNNNAEAEFGIASPLTQTKSDSFLKINKWNYLVTTYDNNIVRMYINGKKVKEKVIGNGYLDFWSDTSSLYIGLQNGNNYFKGTLDELRIYNRALDDSDISSLYRNNGVISNLSQFIVAPKSTTQYTLTESNVSGCTARNQAQITVNPYPTDTIKTPTGTSVCAGDSLMLIAKGNIAGNTLIFDGVDDYVKVPVNTVGIPNNVSLEAWVNPASLSGVQRVMSTDGFSYGLNDTGMIFSVFGVQDYKTTKPTGIKAGKWNHLAVVFDTKNDVSFYVNGNFIEKISGSGTAKATSMANIGCRYDNTEYFAGKIDEFRVWTTSLTQSQIQTNMHARVARSSTNLVADFSFDEGAGNAAYQGGTNNTFAEIMDSAAWVVSDAPIYPTYHWTGGTISSVSKDTVYVKPSSTTTYKVSVYDPLIGCAKSDSVSITVKTKPVPIISSSSATCKGSTSVYSANAGASSYLWKTSAGTIISATNKDSFSIKWTATGAATITLIESNALGCVDSVIKTVIVGSVPTVSIGSPATICAGTTVSLGSSSASGTFYTWSSNPTGFSSKASSVFVKPGTTTMYYLNVQDSASSCSNNDSVKITVNSSPTAIINSTSTGTCQNSTATYFASKLATGITYQWKISGGTITSGSTSDTVQVTWGKAGSATLTLIETNAGSCTDTSKLYLTLGAAPTANAGKSATICSGSSISIGSSASSTSGKYYTWTSIPSGVYSKFPSISVSPSITTMYYLAVQDSASLCTGYDSVKITVVSSPSAMIGGMDSLCANMQLQYLASAYKGATYTWKLTGGTLIHQNADTLVVNWKNAGTGSLFLKVTDGNGCKDSQTVTVKVFANPVAGFISSKVCQGIASSFKDTSTAHSTQFWDFGDGKTSGLRSPAHVYSASGTYTVKMSILTNKGCSDSAKRAAIVDSIPNAKFFWTNACIGDTTKFMDSTLGSATHVWNFGDGKSSSALNPSHIYAASGKYNATLKVSYANGCSDSANNIVQVFDLPNAHWTGTGNNTTFAFHADDSLYSSTMYSWDFGDKSKGFGAKPLHFYAKDSSYQISLVVKDGNGCINKFDSSIKVYTGIETTSIAGLNLTIFPNPFQSQTHIQCKLSSSAQLKISIYDMLGREISLLENSRQEAGLHTYQFNPDKFNCRKGVYLIKILVDDKIIVREIIRN